MIDQVFEESIEFDYLVVRQGRRLKRIEVVNDDIYDFEKLDDKLDFISEKVSKNIDNEESLKFLIEDLSNLDEDLYIRLVRKVFKVELEKSILEGVVRKDFLLFFKFLIGIEFNKEDFLSIRRRVRLKEIEREVVEEEVREEVERRVRRNLR